MPVLPPNAPVGRVGGVWRAWTNVFTYRSGQWVAPRYVWAFLNGSWRVVWAATPALAESPAAALQGDGTVDVTFDAPDPEAVTSYNVRRSDGSLVASVSADGSADYTVTDSVPLIGEHAYTITSVIAATVGGSVSTNTVTVDLTPNAPTVTFVDVSLTRTARVAWTGEQPGTDSVQVYRPNGVLAGTVAAGVGTFDDSAPPANIDDGTYVVRALDSLGRNGGEAASAPLDIALTPPSATLADNDGDLALTVNWSSAVGEHNGFVIRYGGVVVLTPDEGAATIDWTVPASWMGYSANVEVMSRINGNWSSPRVADVAAFNPDVPTSVDAVATGAVGQGRLTWGNPANGIWSAFQVQWSDDGIAWNESANDVSPVTITFGGSSGTRYFRVRTLSASGGWSQWVASVFDPVWDTTPPALPTITSLKPEASYGRLVYRFTINDGTTNQYRTRYRVNDGSWVTGSWTNVLYGAGQPPLSIAVVVGTFANTNDVDVQIQVRDSLNNESAWSSSWRYKLKAQEQIVFPTGTAHYRQGVWAYLGNDRIYQGYFSNPSYLYYGYLFYGSAISSACNADGTVGGDITVTGMDVTLERPNSTGDSVENLYLGVSTQASASGARAAITDTSFMGTITRGTSKVFALTAAHRAKLTTGAAVSLGLDRNSTEYLMLSGQSENVLQGAFRIYSLG